MKTLAALLFFLSSTAFAVNKVPLLNGKLYIPVGYDTNDPVEVTVLGSLPDSCHRSPTYEVERSGRNINIYLYAYYVPEDRGCRKISVPYQETINLGFFQEGNYLVQLKSSRVISKAPLKIKTATSSLQDDFQYGNVMNILEDEDSRVIKLVGTNPTNCLIFDKLVTEIQNDVIVLRPRFREEGICEEEPTEFSINYEVPFLARHPRGVLLHVRVMGGRSFNYLFRNRL
ncbi:MAG: hypothetical protein ACLGHN_13735 [Bacteriovoracia bacterium]